jgi:hypothetical protein
VSLMADDQPPKGTLPAEDAAFFLEKKEKDQ